MSETGTTKRVFKNTFFLYARMLFLIFVQLYSVPIILKTLGVEDYGIYNVVGGVVTLFSFVGSSLASGSQRFLSYSLGRNDGQELRKVFMTTMTIYIVISIIIVFILEALGVWFLNNKMQIPEQRLIAANWVFQLSILAFVIYMLSIPFNAAIIAHERMSVYAYVSIIEGVLKLGAAISLKYFSYDYLIVYAIMICAISLMIRGICQIFCIRNFEECRNVKFSCDIGLGKSLLSYSGWNMIGTLALIGRNQGLNVVINLFFGPVLNAAHSIAQQINGVLTQFINNIYTATRPQITKYYARNKEKEMWHLAISSSKWTFFLLMLISIPALLELKQVLSLWLGKEMPPYSYEISLLLILSLLIETTGNQIISVFQAKNNIKKYQIFASSLLLLNIPVSYCMLKFMSTSPMLPYYISAFLSLVYVASILIIAKREIGLDINYYVKNVLSRMIGVFIFSLLVSYCFTGFFEPTIYRIIYTTIFSCLASAITIWFIGFDKVERNSLKNIIYSKFKEK